MLVCQCNRFCIRAFEKVPTIYLFFSNCVYLLGTGVLEFDNETVLSGYGSMWIQNMNNKKLLKCSVLTFQMFRSYWNIPIFCWTA